MEYYSPFLFQNASSSTDQITPVWQALAVKSNEQIPLQKLLNKNDILTGEL